jgi:hypothetical protein
MTQQEIDQINLEALQKAVPADRQEVVLLIWQMNKAFDNYKIFLRIISEKSFNELVPLFAKIFKQEKNNQHFYWKFIECDGFKMFFQSLDYKNQFLFLDYLFNLKSE